MTKKLKAPAHLKPATAAWWLSVQKEFVLEEHHTRLLTLACEAYDRGEQAREVLTVDGLVVRDDRRNLRPHPLLVVEKDCRIAFARLVRELGLDVDAPASAQRRPPALRGNGG